MGCLTRGPPGLWQPGCPAQSQPCLPAWSLPQGREENQPHLLDAPRIHPLAPGQELPMAQLRGAVGTAQLVLEMSRLFTPYKVTHLCIFYRKKWCEN